MYGAARFRNQLIFSIGNRGRDKRAAAVVLPTSYVGLRSRPGEVLANRNMDRWLATVLGFRSSLNDLQLCRDQTRRIDAHPAGWIEPTLFVARRANRPNMGIGYLGEAADRTRRVELG